VEHTLSGLLLMGVVETVPNIHLMTYEVNSEPFLS
jgi:hypothetical protein